MKMEDLMQYIIHGNYTFRDQWLKEANNERLARAAAEDPEHYLPGDVAWVVGIVRSVARWLASGLGNTRPTDTTPQFPVGTRRKRPV